MPPPSRRHSQKSRGDWCWCRQAAVTAVVVASLSSQVRAFLSPHVAHVSRHISSHEQQQQQQQQQQQWRRVGKLSSATTASSAKAAHPQEASAAEAVHSVFLDSLVKETTNPREPVKSLEEAKRELLERVGFGTQAPAAERSQSEEERVGYLLEVLEANYKPILTVGFFNFAAQGDWDLAYTNAAMPPIGPRLEVYQQFQRIEPGEGVKGNITNILDWRLLDEGIDGRLEVGCDYKFDPRGRMDASLLIHRLVPKKMPSDPQELVKLLRRAMPHELFNPDGHALETTFLDNTLRIVRMRGPKLEGRLNIFARRVNGSDAADNDDKSSEDEQDPKTKAAPKPATA